MGSKIRSLAVRPEHLGNRVGSKLVEHMLLEAKSLEIQKVFALTYRPGFF
jgi:amino-acid N-acetyltransferase